MARLLVLVTLGLGCMSRSLPHSDNDLGIVRVVCDVDTVFPGQRLVAVSLRLENRTNEPMEIAEASPVFAVGETPVDEQYFVEPASDNPTQIASATGVTLRFWIDVHGDVTPGTVSVDGEATIRRSDDSSLTKSGAEEPDSWVVAGQPAVVVTTAVDEDDTAGNPTVEAAGGALDVALREAILIANASGGPRAVFFDPGSFPPDGDVRIDLDDLLGPLPAITNPGTAIDGSGAGVVIDGGAIDDGHGLVLAADDITLRRISVQRVDGDEHLYCVFSDEVDRVSIIESEFTACGLDEGGGASVKLYGGVGHVVVDSRFVNGHRDGLYLSGGASSSIVRDNTMNNNGDDGLSIGGAGNLVQGNVIENNGGAGCETGGNTTTGLIFRGNRFIDNENGVTMGNGISGCTLTENLFAENSYFGVRLSGDTTSGITVVNNVFDGNRAGAIGRFDDANESTPPPAVTSFNGVYVEGTSAVEGGSVEVYRVAALWSPVGTASVSGGTWSVDLDEPIERVTAVVTSPAGSTGEFSDVARTPGAALVVSTPTDEADGGDAISTVAEAGGSGDLSLREAIIIANNVDGPDEITFNPVVFPVGGEVVISLAGELLPRVMDSHTEIDGSGAGVVIDGGVSLYSSGTGLLHIIGHDVSITGLALRNYNSPGGACVLSDDAEHLEVRDCELINCGAPTEGAGIKVLGSASQPQIVGNTIQNASNGITMADATNGLIFDNEIWDTRGSAVYLNDDDDGHTIIDNDLHDCEGAGVKLGYHSTGNQVIGNRVWRCAEGVVLQSSAGGNDVWFNTLVLNEAGVLLREEASAELRNNILAHNASTGIEATTTEVWSEDHNLFFDNGGDGATGANAIVDASATAIDASDVLVDPGLANAANGDMTPSAGAIDAGVDLGLDRNGLAAGLFNGAAPDIGAVETP